MTWICRLFVTGLLVSSACGDDSPGGAADAAPRADADDSDARAGATDFQPDFAGQVRVMEGTAGTEQEFRAVYALILDTGLLPVGELLARDGDCAIYTHPGSGNCAPTCMGDYCNASNQCVPFPSAVSAGVITVTGLSQLLEFTPQSGGGYTAPFVDVDLFDDGDPITISAAGDQVSAFSAQLSGVAPLVVATPSVDFESGTEQVITWTAENSGRIQLALVVGHHLSPYESLVLCETDDDGSLTITSELIAQVPRQSSFLEPHISTMARFNREIIDASVGPIEVIVGHQIYFNFVYFPEQ